MLKTSIVIVIFALSMGKSNSFGFRPLPGLYKNTLNTILHRQLERRFGPIITTTSTTVSPTSTTSTTTVPSIEEQKKLEFQAIWNAYMKKCKGKKSGWCKFLHYRRPFSFWLFLYTDLYTIYLANFGNTYIADIER